MKTKISFSRSFIHAFSNGLNLYGQTIKLESDDSSQRDYEALRKDWEDVGTSIKEAAEKYATC